MYLKTLFVFLELDDLEKEYQSIEVLDEHKVGDYTKIKSQLNSLTQDFLRYLTDPKYIVPFLSSGRLVKVCVCMLGEQGLRLVLV